VLLMKTRGEAKVCAWMQDRQCSSTEHCVGHRKPAPIPALWGASASIRYSNARAKTKGRLFSGASKVKRTVGSMDSQLKLRSKPTDKRRTYLVRGNCSSSNTQSAAEVSRSKLNPGLMLAAAEMRRLFALGPIAAASCCCLLNDKGKTERREHFNAREYATNQ
jgi:hypothetical protein